MLQSFETAILLTFRKESKMRFDKKTNVKLLLMKISFVSLIGLKNPSIETTAKERKSEIRNPKFEI